MMTRHESRSAGAGPPPLVRALLRPQAFPHAAGDLRLHETHCSWVVLAGRFAYKLKKPVDLGFLDFTTVERRAAACAEEVRLNQRLAPDVYLGVVWVVERGGALFLGGRGRPVEPAVRMRRLPEAGMLPCLLARRAVGPRLARRLAARLAAFHAAAPTGPGVDEWGGLEVVRANWAENLAQTAGLDPDVLPPAARAAVERYVARFLEGQAPLLARRVAEGRVREGHGDLHAANVCVDGHRLVLFDCLEFAPRFRCADVAAEVAFLAMDLSHHGRADLGGAFVAAYVRASGDAELPLLLDFYACYRAYVRGKVLALRLGQGGLPAAEAAAVADEAGAYFELARAYAERAACPLPPLLAVVMGLPASGKSTVARALAGRRGLVHLSSDVVRKELAGLPPTEHYDVPFGEGPYSAGMTRRTYAALLERAGRWLRRGHPVVLDATFGRPAQRAALLRLARRCRARLVVLVCHADEAQLRARLAARAREPADSPRTSDARLELWPALRAAYSEPAEVQGAVLLQTAAPLVETVRRAVDAVRGCAAGAGGYVPAGAICSTAAPVSWPARSRARASFAASRGKVSTRARTGTRGARARKASPSRRVRLATERSTRSPHSRA
jgi:aminoglycoside phosphotransferase family enzyme/predicted kinase